MTIELHDANSLKQMQCVGKDAFDTFSQADTIARKTKLKKHSANISAYKCPWCPHYHIGSRNIKSRHKKYLKPIRR